MHTITTLATETEHRRAAAGGGQIVFGLFAGAIDNAAVARLFRASAQLVADGATHLHLLFQSSGGFVGDGICLYSFFRSFPIELTVYNGGAVRSIAAVAYLGARHRKVSPDAAFMIHRSSTNLQGASIDRVSAALTNLNVEDERIQGILRRELRLSRDHWAAFAKSDLMLSASDALAVGLADEIVTFTPSPGCSLLSI